MSVWWSGRVVMSLDERVGCPQFSKNETTQHQKKQCCVNANASPFSFLYVFSFDPMKRGGGKTKTKTVGDNIRPKLNVCIV